MELKVLLGMLPAAVSRDMWSSPATTAAASFAHVQMYLAHSVCGVPVRSVLVTLKYFFFKRPCTRAEDCVKNKTKSEIDINKMRTLT
jgi:hypothetical protein